MNKTKDTLPTQKVSKTKAAELLINAKKEDVFTVRFKKADGRKRTLVGTLHNTENHMGRSNVIDHQVYGGGSQIRQVDHRTIEWLILRGTRYQVKK